MDKNYDSLLTDLREDAEDLNEVLPALAAGAARLGAVAAKAGAQLLGGVGKAVQGVAGAAANAVKGVGSVAKSAATGITKSLSPVGTSTQSIGKVATAASRSGATVIRKTPSALSGIPADSSNQVLGATKSGSKVLNTPKTPTRAGGVVGKPIGGANKPAPTMKSGEPTGAAPGTTRGRPSTVPRQAGVAPKPELVPRATSAKAPGVPGRTPVNKNINLSPKAKAEQADFTKYAADPAAKEPGPSGKPADPSAKFKLSPKAKGEKKDFKKFLKNPLGDKKGPSTAAKDATARANDKADGKTPPPIRKKTGLTALKVLRALNSAPARNLYKKFDRYTKRVNDPMRESTVSMDATPRNPGSPGPGASLPVDDSVGEGVKDAVTGAVKSVARAIFSPPTVGMERLSDVEAKMRAKRLKKSKRVTEDDDQQGKCPHCGQIEDHCKCDVTEMFGDGVLPGSSGGGAEVGNMKEEEEEVDEMYGDSSGVAYAGSPGSEFEPFSNRRGAGGLDVGVNEMLDKLPNNAKWHSPDGGYGRVWMKHDKGWSFYQRNKKRNKWEHSTDASHADMGEEDAGKELPATHPAVSSIKKDHFTFESASYAEALGELLSEAEYKLSHPAFMQSTGGLHYMSKHDNPELRKSADTTLQQAQDIVKNRPGASKATHPLDASPIHHELRRQGWTRHRDEPAEGFSIYKHSSHPDHEISVEHEGDNEFQHTYIHPGKSNTLAPKFRTHSSGANSKDMKTHLNKFHNDPLYRDRVKESYSKCLEDLMTLSEAEFQLSHPAFMQSTGGLHYMSKHDNPAARAAGDDTLKQAQGIISQHGKHAAAHKKILSKHGWEPAPSKQHADAEEGFTAYTHPKRPGHILDVNHSSGEWGHSSDTNQKHPITGKPVRRAISVNVNHSNPINSLGVHLNDFHGVEEVRSEYNSDIVNEMDPGSDFGTMPTDGAAPTPSKAIIGEEGDDDDPDDSRPRNLCPDCGKRPVPGPKGSSYCTGCGSTLTWPKPKTESQEDDRPPALAAWHKYSVKNHKNLKKWPTEHIKDLSAYVNSTLDHHVKSHGGVHVYNPDVEPHYAAHHRIKKEMDRRASL